MPNIQCIYFGFIVLAWKLMYQYYIQFITPKILACDTGRSNAPNPCIRPHSHGNLHFVQYISFEHELTLYGSLLVRWTIMAFVLHTMFYVAYLDSCTVYEPLRLIWKKLFTNWLVQLWLMNKTRLKYVLRYTLCKLI